MRIPGDTGSASAQQHDLSVRQQLNLSALWFSLNFFSAALLPIVLPVQVVLFVAPGQVGNAQQAVILSWLTTLGAVVSLFVPPIAGALSDRTLGPLGRRRPYIAAGAVFMAFSASVLAAPRSIFILLAGLFLYQLGTNVCTAGYQGLLPDLVPEHQRGEASGYMGIMTIGGNAASLGIAAVLLGNVGGGASAGDAIRHGSALYYFFAGVLLVLGALFTVFGVHETPLSRSPLPQLDGQATGGMRRRLGHLASMWIEPWHSRNYRLVFLTRCSVMMGLTLFLTFIEYYFASVAHIPNFVQETAALAVLALVGAAASAFVLGLLSDRIGRVAIVCFATGCMAVASLVFVILPQSIPLWPLGLVFGLGYGAYTSVDWALAVDVLPSAGAAGKDMGIWTLATTLPAILAPVFGGVAISVAGAFGATSDGYRAVFALAVACMVAGAVFILLVRDTISAPAGAHGQRRQVGLGWLLAASARAGQARGFLRFWPFWERITMFVHRVRPIPGAPYGLFLVEFRKHDGRPIVMPDSTEVRRGDRIAEVHINNRAIVSVIQPTPTWRILAMLAADLRALERWSEEATFPADVRALYAFTLLSNGAARLGFTLRERPVTIRTRLDRFFLVGLLALYHPHGVERLREGTTYSSFPVEIWMSRQELRRRYGEHSRDA